MRYHRRSRPPHHWSRDHFVFPSSQTLHPQLLQHPDPPRPPAPCLAPGEPCSKACWETTPGSLFLPPPP